MNSAKVDDYTDSALISIERMYKLGMIDLKTKRTLTRKAKAWAFDRLDEIDKEVRQAFEGRKTK